MPRRRHAQFQPRHWRSPARSAGCPQPRQARASPRRLRAAGFRGRRAPVRALPPDPGAAARRARGVARPDACRSESAAAARAPRTPAPAPPSSPAASCSSASTSSSRAWRFPTAISSSSRGTWKPPCTARRCRSRSRERSTARRSSTLPRFTASSPGELTARTRLVVHGTGKVSGTIRYGRLIVAEGGTISGDMKQIDAVEPRAPPARQRRRPARAPASRRARRPAIRAAREPAPECAAGRPASCGPGNGPSSP